MSEFSDEVQEKKVQQANQFKCPSCGGYAIFDPESQNLKCEYCDSISEIKEIVGEINERDFFAIDEENLSNDWGVETRVVHCDNCGGETVLEANDVSTRCVYCGSPQVVTTSELPGIKPESVMPFKLSSKEAKKQFKRWISKRFWAPNAIKKDHKIDEKLKGLYVPHWTYDASTISQYNGLAGEHYMVPQQYTVNVNGRNEVRTRMVQKTRWFPVSGSYADFADDVLLNDSTNLDDAIITHIQPFQLDQLKLYNPAYLVGFAAEKYAKGVKELWKKAKVIIANQIKNGIYMQILSNPRADVVGQLNIQTDYNKITYKHILLPIWISAYTFKRKLYKFYINGQTGEVQGKAPTSAWKVLLAVIITAAVIYGIYLLTGDMI